MPTALPKNPTASETEFGISSTIILPTPLLAASFIIFIRTTRLPVLLAHAQAVQVVHYLLSSFFPDLIALAMQGVGGGMPSSARNFTGANTGTKFMLGGLAFQFDAPHLESPSPSPLIPASTALSEL
ncbi:hypothetical protein B0H17DRAFT_1197578 [Mycena rosella]|uniref:Uncharacterized protein n=1 Tax=Mycena rosella TaxID=1033263 RepID=A0AAD7GJ52_MYCRO|nr:hypothetical protein B0H17DRAFT_1197578 [Mycena rosella]